MAAEVPVPVPTPATLAGGFWQNNSCGWNVTINVGFLVAVLMVVYLIHTWKQERGCRCELEALKAERQRSG
jgi:hypothetical protein